MPIRINIIDSHPNLFCDSKWWGDPELPEDLKYPMSDGIPMTFICQLSLSDFSKYDEESILPEEGMFYFFIDLDEYIGQKPDKTSELSRSSYAVRYSKSVNLETMATVQLLDEDDKPIAPPAYPLEFSKASQEDLAKGTVLLGRSLPQDICKAVPESLSLLSFTFGQTRFHFVISLKDMGFGNWKRARLFACPL